VFTVKAWELLVVTYSSIAKQPLVKVPSASAKHAKNGANSLQKSGVVNLPAARIELVSVLLLEPNAPSIQLQLRAPPAASWIPSVRSPPTSAASISVSVTKSAKHLIKTGCHLANNHYISIQLLSVDDPVTFSKRKSMIPQFTHRVQKPFKARSGFTKRSK